MADEMDDSDAPNIDTNGFKQDLPYSGLVNGFGSPLTPLIEPMTEINQSYGRFLTSPAEGMIKTMGEPIDPATMATLNNFKTVNGGTGSLVQGILQGFLNANNQGAAGTATQSGEMAAQGLASQAAQQNLGINMQIQDKKDKIIDMVLKDPEIVKADAKLTAARDFESQWSNLLSQTDDKGHPIYTASQVQGLLSSLAQEIRPGARVSAQTGDITDDTGADLKEGPFGFISALLSKYSKGTNIPLTESEIKGIYSISQSLKKSAADAKNARIDYHAKNEASMFHPYFENLKEYSPEESAPDLSAVSEAANESEKTNSKERAEAAGITAGVNPAEKTKKKTGDEVW